MSSTKLLSLVVATLTAITVFIPLSIPAEAALKLCGRDWKSPADMQKLLIETEKFPEAFRDKNYVAYQDKKAETMWTFTLPGIPSHPAVVCRQAIKDGDKLDLHMDVNCDGDPRACDALLKDFQLLNSKMAKEMNKHN